MTGGPVYSLTAEEQAPLKGSKCQILRWLSWPSVKGDRLPGADRVSAGRYLLL